MSRSQMLQNAHPLIHICVLLAEVHLNQLVSASIAEKRSRHYVLRDFRMPMGTAKELPQNESLIVVTDHHTLSAQSEFQKPENPDTFSHWSLILLQNKQDKPQVMELAFPRINRVLRSDKVNDLIKDLHRALEKESAYLMRQQLNLKADAALGRLSPRETEVLELMVQGCSIAEISESLSIAGPTVKIHKSKVLEKTGCKNLRHLILVFAPRYLNDERLFK